MRITPTEKILKKNKLRQWFRVSTFTLYIGLILGVIFLARSSNSFLGIFFIAVCICSIIAKIIIAIYFSMVDSVLPDTSIPENPVPKVVLPEETSTQRERISQAIMPKAQEMKIYSYEGQLKLLESFAKLVPTVSSVLKSETMKRLAEGKTDSKRIIGELILLTEQTICKTDFNYMLHRWNQMDLDTLTDSYLLVDCYLHPISGSNPPGLTAAKNALVKVIDPKLNKRD